MTQDERDAGSHLRKITSAAEGRMYTRTAREQHAEMMRELYAAQDETIPVDDADDASVKGVLQ